jgi:hypothetical protein
MVSWSWAQARILFGVNTRTSAALYLLGDCGDPVAVRYPRGSLGRVACVNICSDYVLTAPRAERPGRFVTIRALS